MATGTETSDSTPAVLRLVAVLPARTPRQAYLQATEPSWITRWWAQEAETDVRPGGDYTFSWPAMGWTLRGTYTVVDAPDRLAFTWNWDHEPDVPERTVTMTFTPDGDDTRLLLTHGTYGADDAEERQGHVDGWKHFLGKLAELRPR